MPPPSEAFQRYEIIDRCLINIYKPYPTMEVLQWEIERELKSTVSSATIQKDIAHMKLSVEEGGYGAPIKYKRSIGGYYYDFDKFPDYTIKQFGLNEKNLETMELAAGVLKHFTGIMSSDSFNNALHKLYASLNIEKSSKETSLANAILPEETTYLRGMEHFELLIKAIKKRIPISFIHYSYDKKLFKAIIIHPYLLKESNDRWYLVGFSEDHEEVRYFGLDRIYDPLLIDKEYIENKETDLRDLFKNKIGLNTLRNGVELIPEEITILVSRTMANYIKSMPLHKSQSYKEYKGHGEIIVTLSLVPTYELISLILSYGHHVELIAPKWLRKEIEKELEKATNKYKRHKS